MGGAWGCELGRVSSRLNQVSRPIGGVYAFSRYVHDLFYLIGFCRG